MQNGRAGLLAADSSGAGARFMSFLGNAAADIYALTGSAVGMVDCTFNTTTPALGIVGNQGAIVTSTTL